MKLENLAKLLLLSLISYILGAIFAPDPSTLREKIGVVLIMAGSFAWGISIILLHQESQKRLITAKKG